VSAPLREYAGLRRVQLLHGESLQRLAARELGDAALWPHIAVINNLTPPYVTGDPAAAGRSVALYGDTLLVPSNPTDIEPTALSAEDVLKCDVRLQRGMLDVDRGDLVMVAGRENLRQAIGHRIATDEGELLFHPGYGCRVHRQKGKANNSANSLLSRKWVERALKQEERIASVTSVVATSSGDVITVEAEAMSVTGHPVDSTLRV
jgi:phage baseplate assembly protein W